MFPLDDAALLILLRFLPLSREAYWLLVAPLGSCGLGRWEWRMRSTASGTRAVLTAPCSAMYALTKETACSPSKGR